MSFPNSETEAVKNKKLKKTDIIGLTPKQYILYRINRASTLDIKEEYLDIDVESITMDTPLQTELCEAVAVVKVRGSDKVDWKGVVNYRVPQISIESVYGTTIELPFSEVKSFTDYNTLAKAFLLPPKVYRDVEFIGLEEATLSYRLVFANPFFKGDLILEITGIDHLSEDKAIVDALLNYPGIDT